MKRSEENETLQFYNLCYYPFFEAVRLGCSLRQALSFSITVRELFFIFSPNLLCALYNLLYVLHELYV